MPLAVLKSIREVSSEDHIHSAANLIKNEAGKKWKTRNTGEKSAYVIIELEKAHQITGIDLGNEHSAFIEVLVGKAGSTREDFTEILITCSFMTPIESKNSSNPNRVRCFGHDALVESSASNKWQLVKILCTQPFNKHVQYGLSFLKIQVAKSEDTSKINIPKQILVPETFLSRSISTDSKDMALKPAVHGIGKFALREDSPDSESETSAGLFARWKMARKNTFDSKTAASAIRDASSPNGLSQHGDNKFRHNMAIKTLTNDGNKESTKNEMLDRNREQLIFGDDVEESNKYLEKQILVDQKRLQLEAEKLMKQTKKRKLDSRVKSPKSKNDTNPDKAVDMVVKSPKQSLGREYPSISKTTSPSNRFSSKIEKFATGSSKKLYTSPSSKPAKKIKPEVTTQYKPFKELLKGVVFVISGVQNPQRTDLRNKALAMGAKYKADWESSCTHLICAFKNTPKYSQVKGKGKIVTRSWIEECYTLRKRLPWRRYAIDSEELIYPESEVEIVDETLNTNKSVTGQSHTPPNCKEKVVQLHEDDENDLSLQMYDLGGENTNAQTYQTQFALYGSDTEDEIERVKSPSNNQSPILEEPLDDIFEVSTEEDDYVKEKKTQNENSLDIFRDKKFYISRDIGFVDVNKLENLITRFRGSVTKSLTSAHYLLTNKLVETEHEQFSGETVTPLWIYECNDMETLVPINRYKIS